MLTGTLFLFTASIRGFLQLEEPTALRRHFMGLFSFGNKNKSQGVRSGEYGGCGIISVLFLAKKSRTSSDV
ncbi:hypothetical protein J6590_016106 [Homalodisca vitripennis]|nr:hypothetical protein J6590_016106 [Homalodisca vitripennis]